MYNFFLNFDIDFFFGMFSKKICSNEICQKLALKVKINILTVMIEFGDKKLLRSVVAAEKLNRGKIAKFKKLKTHKIF